MALTEKQIRVRILETIWEICPDARKIHRNILTGDRSKWSGLFRREVSGQIVTHGWIVRRAKLEKADAEHSFDRYTFDLMGFYGYDLGTDADNSEDRFQVILDQLAERFADTGVDDLLWGFGGDENDSAATGSIGFSVIGLIRPSDNELLHYGGGRLVVNIFRC